MRRNVVIIGLVLMVVGTLLFFSGSVVSTGEEALGYFFVGLPLAIFLGGVGFIVFIIGLILRKTIPVKIEPP